MIQNQVFIKKDTHQYFDAKGNEYVSVSKVLDSIDYKFDSSIAKRCAGKGKYSGMSESQILKAWDDNRDEAANHGTRIHDAIEQYTNFFTIKPGNEDLEPMLKGIANDYIPYKTTLSEEILYSVYAEAIGVRIAGTTDRIMIVKGKSGFFDIEDYKTNISKGIQYYDEKYGKFLKSPVEHLSCCNYNRYALQMSIYATMVEELTGMKCRSLWIRFIPNDNPLDYRRIPVNYLKTDAYNILLNFAHSNKHEEVSEEEQIPKF